MTRRINSFRCSTSTLFKIVFITVFLVIFLSSASIPLFGDINFNPPKKEIHYPPLFSPGTSNLFENNILYTEIRDGLIINETAIYNSNQHYWIGNGSVAGYTSQNAEYPVDATHDWEGFYYNASIINIQDERDWIENGIIGSDIGLTPSFHVVQQYNSSHPYLPNRNHNQYISTIDGSGCDYMRLHFVSLDVEYYYDLLYIKDGSNTILDTFAGNYSDFCTPWYAASTLKISIASDGYYEGYEHYGYLIDFYETYDGSMFTIDNTNWNYYENTITNPSRLYGGVGELGNHSALYVVTEGIDNAPSYSYKDDDEAGFYQDLSIPRGTVIDAWVSMDYNLLRGIETNDIYAFIKINDETVYSRGFRTITDAGLGQWHSSGLINLALWENNSAIFDEVINGQSITLSVGIQHGNGVEYTGFDHLDIQEAYFDNVRLILKTTANTTQSDINLEFNGLSLIDSSSEWGSATFNRYDTWTLDPMVITITADCRKLEFDLTSQLYGYHTTNSRHQIQGTPGTLLTILTNNTVLWQTYHNVHIPSEYEDFIYKGIKPSNWYLTKIEDPTGLDTPYINGQKFDSTFEVSTSVSGWWKIYAESANMLLDSNTEVWNGSWQHYKSDLAYDVNDAFSIRTILNMSESPIGNILTTNADLTIYHPNETIWHTESVSADITGIIQFSNVEIGASNTTGGLYKYSITWMNGTAAGGINGSFKVLHDIQFTLLYPRDAITDLHSENILGDVIPFRIKVNDSSSGMLLSNIDIEYNWTSGNQTFLFISNGIYTTSLDTEDIGVPGFIEVDVSLSAYGFYNKTFTLSVDLVAETELRIIGLDSNIEYGTNFSIRIDYSLKWVSTGITSAGVSLNLTDPSYSVIPEAEYGQYEIQINSSLAFPSAGTYDIKINVTSLEYQTQELVTRVQILSRSVTFDILINSSNCNTNKSYSSEIRQFLNFSIGVETTKGEIPVLGGTIQLTKGTWASGVFTIDNGRFNGLINSSVFGFGVHFISIIFNETGYQSASDTIQLTISPLKIGAQFEESDTKLVTKKEDFSTKIFLHFPNSLNPILNATVAYSWTFGTGFLSELGEGYYEFSETAPTQEGTYEITFTITTSDPDFEPQTIKLTLVSQASEVPFKWWWIIVPTGAAIAILSGSLIVIGVKSKRTKKREEELTKLKQKTQIFDDIINIKGILVIEKQSGLLMYKHVISGLDEENEELFSGFIRAILLLGKRFIRDDKELEKGMVFEKQEFIEFTHENFKILLAGGHKIIVALILEQQASESIKQKAAKFIEEFEGIYASVLEEWNGNRSIFEDTTPKLFEEIFNLSLLKPFQLSENSEIYEKKFISSNSMLETVSTVIKTLLEEKENFHLKTIISLIPEDQKLSAKDTILKFIKNKYITPVER